MKLSNSDKSVLISLLEQKIAHWKSLKLDWLSDQRRILALDGQIAHAGQIKDKLEMSFDEDVPMIEISSDPHGIFTRRSK